MSCKAEGCFKDAIAKGYCSRHYYQVKKYGKVVKTIYDPNEIVDKGSHYEIILTNKKVEEVGRAKIDKEDLSKVKAEGKWCLHGDGYVKSSSFCLLHRLVMDATKNEIVDHKNTGRTSKLDNRKRKLRKCTYQENNFNVTIRNDNTSGYKGVSWSKSKNKWRAYISIDGKYKHLGYFSDIKQAHKAYKRCAKELHGNFYNQSLK